MCAHRRAVAAAALMSLSATTPVAVAAIIFACVLGRRRERPRPRSHATTSNATPDSDSAAGNGLARTGGAVVVTNTHLYWNPACEVSALNRAHSCLCVAFQPTNSFCRRRSISSAGISAD